MKPSKRLAASLVCGIALLLAHEANARLAADPAASKTPVNLFRYPPVKPCPDLKADLALMKGESGMVTITGTVTNVGKEDYTLDSVAEVIMNLAYAPQYSYAMTGVSDILVTRSFTGLKAGASISVRAAYQIPDFGGWASAGTDNAKRLFTLRIIKKDMSPYKPGEDCNAENNVLGKTVDYRDLKH